MKSALCFLLMAIGLSSCLTKPYQVYWLHLEGAPPRFLFDQWSTPLTPSDDKASFDFEGETLYIPKTFFHREKASPILRHMNIIRSIQTSSPHLKEAREEWFTPLKEVDLPITLSAQSEKLGLIYKRMLEGSIGGLTLNEPSQKSLHLIKSRWAKKSPHPLPASLHTLFASWLNSSSKGINLAVINHYQDLFFENLTQLDSQNKALILRFYEDLLTGLEIFVSVLKEQGLFKRSVILLTSDRNRIVVENGKMALTWEGIPLSIISGALKGPYVLGNIRRTHPKYEKTFPGTWGVGLNDWNPKNVHDFIIDLKSPTKYIDLKEKRASQNPWYHLSPFQNLGPKLKWGQLF